MFDCQTEYVLSVYLIWFYLFNVLNYFNNGPKPRKYLLYFTTKSWISFYPVFIMWMWISWTLLNMWLFEAIWDLQFEAETECPDATGGWRSAQPISCCILGLNFSVTLRSTLRRCRGLKPDTFSSIFIKPSVYKYIL